MTDRGSGANPYHEGDHYDHVHVATYDKGGILKPGRNRVCNPPAFRKRLRLAWRVLRGLR